MKRTRTISALILSVGLFASCDKDTVLVAPTEEVSAAQAFLKINYVSAYTANPGVQLKLNNVRVSNLITARTPFPGGGYNTGGGSTNDYLPLTPGAIPLSVSIPKRLTATDSVVLFNAPVTVEAGKYYSAHITDTGANTKMVLLQDNLTQPNTGNSRHRFVNLMPNVPAIDLYYGTTKVASNIAYLSASPYFDLPRPATTMAWSIREAGTAPTSAALATYTNVTTTQDQRVYTSFAMGYKGGTTTRLPYVAFYFNN